MNDLFPEPPKSTRYSQAFEDCWKVHAVGNKKAAWKAGQKAEFGDANWVWLRNYLEKRWREDAKWAEGTYVPHLSTIINGERWDDPYPKIKKLAQKSDDFRRRPVDWEASAAARDRALAELRGEMH